MAIKYHNIFDKKSIKLLFKKQKTKKKQETKKKTNHKATWNERKDDLNKIEQIFFHTTLQLLLTENHKWTGGRAKFPRKK